MPILTFVFLCAEIVLLAKLAQTTGGLGVLIEILVTGLVGYGLLRSAGRRMVRTETLIELLLRPAASLRRPGWSLVLAGILFLVPGVLTDVIGLVLVVRHLTTPSRPTPSDEPDVIDVEYEVRDNDRT